MAITKVETYDTSIEGRPTILHDPNAILDYSEDWAAWLAASADDTIVSHEIILPDVTAEWPTPLAMGPNGSGNDDTTVTAWITGGTSGKTMPVTFRITTAAGRTDDRSIFLRVKPR